MEVTAVQTPQPKKKRRSLKLGGGLWPYAFLTPYIVCYAVFSLFPIIFSFYISLTSWEGIGDKVFVGFRNYASVLTTDPYFWKSILNTIILMAIMGFMAAQLIATTLRGSAESAGQIKDLTEATSTLEECIAYLNTEAMQQKAASDLITDKGLEALLEAQDKRELWHPDGCPSCPDNLLITVKRGSVELSRAF